MATIEIRLASQVDAERLTEFRTVQFKSSKEFEVIDASLLRKLSGEVYIAMCDNNIISTMQAEIICTKKSLENKCSSIVPENFNLFNSIYLSKGATSKDFRNTGLNSYLRLLILNKYFADTTINSFSGIGYENAPRINLLKQLGYNLYEIPDTSISLKAFGKVYFLSLERNLFSYAIEALGKETRELLANFRVINNF